MNKRERRKERERKREWERMGYVERRKVDGWMDGRMGHDLYKSHMF